MESNGVSKEGINSPSYTASELQKNENIKKAFSTGFDSKNSISNQDEKINYSDNVEKQVKINPPKESEEEAFKADFDSIKDLVNKKELFNKKNISYGLISEENKISDKKLEHLMRSMSKEQKIDVAKNLFSNDPMGFSKLNENELKQYVKNIGQLQDQAIDAAAHISAITDAPKEVMEELKSLSTGAFQKLLTGNVEDTLRILTEIQTKLQDSRIKFDQEAIQSHKQKMQNTHEQRIDKLHKQLEKLRSAQKWGPLIKALGAILVVLGFIAAAVTGGAAGALMAVGATIMAATFILNETGAMEKMCAGNKDAALGVNIALTILGIAFSLGAGFVAAPKAATQIATETVKQTAQKAASAAAQKAVQEATKGATKEIIQKAAQKAAEKAIEKTVDNVANQAIKAGMKETTKQLIKKSAEEAGREVVAKAAKEAAKQALKKSTSKAIEQSVTQSIKNSANAIGKSSAKMAAQADRFGNFQNIANQVRNGTRIGQGVSLVMQGGLEIDATQKRWDAAKYGAEAKELFAFLTRMQFLTEVLMENIKVIYEQMQESWEVTSDTMKNAFESKQKVLSNLNPSI